MQIAKFVARIMKLIHVNCTVYWCTILVLNLELVKSSNRRKMKHSQVSSVFQGTSQKRHEDVTVGRKSMCRLRRGCSVELALFVDVCMQPRLFPLGCSSHWKPLRKEAQRSLVSNLACSLARSCMLPCFLYDVLCCALYIREHPSVCVNST